jgi:hypothetical protein
MNISFDLDDLLINGTKRFAVEKTGLLQRVMTSECLRLGTIDLFKRLRAQGHNLYIYTTSLRSPFKIRLLFWAHGLSPDGVFNKTSHDRSIRKLSISCSKYPPMFGIDLHIDDSEGVRMEAQKFGFKTLIVEESDLRWTETVLDGVKNMEGSQK